MILFLVGSRLASKIILEQSEMQGGIVNDKQNFSGGRYALNILNRSSSVGNLAAIGECTAKMLIANIIFILNTFSPCKCSVAAILATRFSIFDKTIYLHGAYRFRMS